MDDLVTIGIPVRNGGEQLRIALDSVLAQTHRNITVLISDNCSTDNTCEIAEEYAARDYRVKLVRQPVNLGICGNFRYLLHAATSPYFMWACHDDRWSPTFIEKNLANLKTDPEAIGSVSRVILINPEGKRSVARGTAALPGDGTARVKAFLDHPSEASRFYAVFQTKALQDSFPDDIDVFGYDYVILAMALMKGKILEVPEFLMERDQHDYMYYLRSFVAKRPTLFKRWFAHRDLAQVIRRKLDIQPGSVLDRTLTRLEARQVVQYGIYKFPFLRAPAKLLKVGNRRAIDHGPMTLTLAD